MNLTEAKILLGASKVVESDASECDGCKKMFKTLYLSGGTYEYPDEGELLCHRCLKKEAYCKEKYYESFKDYKPEGEG